MIRILPYNETAPEEVFSRVVPQMDVTGIVRDIITEVRSRGDEALLEYTERFDGAKLTALEVSNEEIEEAAVTVEPRLLQILEPALTVTHYYIQVGLKLKMQKTKFISSGPISSRQIDGDTMKTVRDFVLGAPKSPKMVTETMKLKDTYSLEEKL